MTKKKKKKKDAISHQYDIASILVSFDITCWILVISDVDFPLCTPQAFVNIVLTLCDAGDSVVMFAPYYFNAYMSFQMTGVTDILVGPCNPKTLQPDVGETSLFVPTSNAIL